MKKITTFIVAFLVAFSFTSCNDDSLQSYLVKSQEKSGFITFDVPASILQIKSDNVSEETKATLESIKKINVVAMPFKDNATEVEAEKAQLDKIFKGKGYKSIMRFTEKNMKVSLYYTGDPDAIDELIAYVSQYFTIKKGDLIFTGTPAGVGKVSENDVLKGVIKGKEAFNIRVK